MDDIGKRISAMMKDMGINQEELANYLDISQPYLSQILSGNRNMSLTIFNKICALFGCSESYLLGNSTEFSHKNFAFRSKNINSEDLACIASMNKLYENLIYLNKKQP